MKKVGETIIAVVLAVIVTTADKANTASGGKRDIGPHPTTIRQKMKITINVEGTPEVELTYRDVCLLVQGARCGAVISRQSGHADQAKDFGDLAEKVDVLCSKLGEVFTG
jgi:hypothetical protein